MTKGERLIWDLFMKLREVLPASADNSKWATEWAAVFHEMEHPDVVEAVDRVQAIDTADHDEDEPPADDDVPHVRSAPKRKRK